MRRVGFISLLFTLCALILHSAPAHAAGASCTVEPASGPPGTRFQIYCTGFTPNTHLNTYVVEPDGRAVSGAQVVGFRSVLGATGSARSDPYGNAWFWWQSQDGREPLPFGGTFAHQLGDWTWVIHELAPGGAVALQGQVTVHLENSPWEQSGARLAVSSKDKVNWDFVGIGFLPNEAVNTWVTLPVNCSGRTDVEAASAEDPWLSGVFDGFYGPSVVKADEDGNIEFSVLFRPEACRGEYKLTAYAPGSGRGAEVAFTVEGMVPQLGSGQTLMTAPATVDALAPRLTLLGSGFSANAQVNCWTTRPDGRSFAVGTARTDASGSFALDTSASGGDSNAPLASEEPGIWSATCRVPNTDDAAFAVFTVFALTSDP